MVLPRVPIPVLWHCPSDALPSRHAFSRPPLTYPALASLRTSALFPAGKLRHRALPAASQPPCKCLSRGSSGTKAVPVNPPFPLLCKPLILHHSSCSRCFHHLPAAGSLRRPVFPSQLDCPSRSLLNPSHPWALLLFPPCRLLLQRAKTTDLPTQKNAGEFTPSWRDFGHPGRDFGHPGGLWPTQEMCQRRWRLRGTAFSSWLWGK